MQRYSKLDSALLFRISSYAMLTVKKLAGVAPQMDLGSHRLYITFASAMQISRKLEETSPEIQKRGTCGPKIGHTYVSKTLLN